MSLSLAAELLDRLRETELPVLKTFIPPQAALHLLVVSVDKPAWRGSDGELISKIGQTIWASKAGLFISKVLVVNKDIEASNFDKVLWAFATRNHPGHGVYSFPDTLIMPLIPFLSAAEKAAQKSTTVIFDCTWPSDWPKDAIPRNASFDSLWPKEIQEKVTRDWEAYGYRSC